jgi:glyoxylase-like metal-dependent hydrolase (beta-lactamase superfamily II)
MRFALLLALGSSTLFGSVQLPNGITFQRGAANIVTIGASTAVYGVPLARPRVSRVLLTHARRDAISGVTAKSASNIAFVAPAAERELFEKPESFWNALEKDRFHDYAQLSTKVPVQPLPITQAVSDGDVLEEGSSHIRVISTPGFTRGAVSYLIETGGKRIACTGDLIYGDGQILDLYSLQDAVPEAKARGYHGYAARAVDLIASLRRIAAAKPDVILPARGPAIDNAAVAIDRLISHLQSFLASHFEVDALRWYWGDENHRIRSRAVERTMEIMPMAEQTKLPADILAIGNSRLIISRSGAAFLVDAGYSKLLPELRRLRDNGEIKSLDGIWITHYHDDHTDYVNDVAAEFRAPVYFTAGMTKVLENPGAFRLPCLTTRAIPVSDAKRDGETLRWREWQFTFWNFPGQTLYHGGLVARRDNGDTILFAGDSFTPSGMDDYCMQNRDILRSGEGYEYCLRKIAKLDHPWLINQHVEPMFRYSDAQISRMERELEKRSATLKQLSPWPDINYMVDESWARIYPYGSDVKAGDTVELQLRVLNHAPDQMKYRVNWNIPSGWTLVDSDQSVTLVGRQEGTLRAQFKAGSPGLSVVTADVSFAVRDLKQWTEALVRVR